MGEAALRQRHRGGLRTRPGAGNSMPVASRGSVVHLQRCLLGIPSQCSESEVISTGFNRLGTRTMVSARPRTDDESDVAFKLVTLSGPRAKSDRCSMQPSGRRAPSRGTLALARTIKLRRRLSDSESLGPTVTPATTVTVWG
jgi:hypothetical protein